MKSLGIALLGCGTVGTGVVRLLRELSGHIAKKAGRPLELHHVLVRNPDKARAVELSPQCVTTDLAKILGDPNVDVVVELAGGTTWAKDAVVASLAAGKHIVTANKALLAHHGDEVFAAAGTAGRAIAFEASVGGGVPMVSTIIHGLTGSRITGMRGILNGTCNFILSKMDEENCSFEVALTRAQSLGFAEADPKLDINGSDTADKLAILCRIAFGVSIHPSQIQRAGIEGIRAEDHRAVSQIGQVIKLVAEAEMIDSKLGVRVSPLRIPRSAPLAQVSGADNGLRIASDAAGYTLVVGPGAGMMPTASAVVADLIDMAIGRAQSTFESLRLWETPPAVLIPPSNS